MIITIDGYAGSGKSSAARRLAEALGFELLNTGGMYRAVGLLLLRAKVDIYSPERDQYTITRIVDPLRFTLSGDRVLVDDVDLTSELHTEELGRAASRVGTFPEVRTKLKQEQRRIADERDIVCEGRDQGTVVFPHAPVKFFFYASPEIRAERRVAQLQAENHTANFEQVRGQIIERDQQDETRPIDPLRQADDALRVDTTTRSPDDVHRLLLEVVERWRCRQ
jgi:cytidylate kinase